MKSLFMLLLSLVLSAPLPAADRPFSLYTRVTEKTVGKLLPHAQKGDLFWGRPEKKIPQKYRALSVRSFENLENRLKRTSLREYAGVVLDGEYRDYKIVVADVTRLRQMIDKHNQKRPKEKLRFIAFFHMRIIDAQPEVVKLPDIVMVGKSYWDAESILGKGKPRRRRTAPPYVKMITLAKKRPAILLGTPDKESHDAKTVKATIDVILKPSQKGGLAVKHIGFFYPRDKAEILLAVLKAYKH